MRWRSLSATVILTVIPLAVLTAAPSILQFSQPPPGQYGIEQLWKVTLNNPDNQTYEVWLEGTITEATRGQVFWARTNKFQLPPGTKVIRYADIQSIGIDQQTYAPGYEGLAARTGGLGEGDYTMTVTLEPKFGSKSVTFKVERPGAPRIIAPRDGAALPRGQKPALSWTKPMPSPAGVVTYEIEVAEQWPGVSKEEAINSMPPYFSQRGITRTTFRIPNSARAFSDTAQYVWCVKAYSDGSLIGKSEIYSFAYSVASAIAYPYYHSNDSCSAELSVYNRSSGDRFRAIRLQALGSTVIKKVTCYGWDVTTGYPTWAIVRPPNGDPIPYEVLDPQYIIVWLASNPSADQQIQATWLGPKDETGRESVLCSQILKTPCLRYADGWLTPMYPATPLLATRLAPGAAEPLETAEQRKQEQLDSINDRLLTAMPKEARLARAAQDSAASAEFLPQALGKMIGELDSMVRSGASGSGLRSKAASLDSSARHAFVSPRLLGRIVGLSAAVEASGGNLTSDMARSVAELDSMATRVRLAGGGETQIDSLCDSVFINVDEDLGKGDCEVNASFTVTRTGCTTFKMNNSSSDGSYEWLVLYTPEGGSPTYTDLESTEKDPVFELKNGEGTYQFLLKVVGCDGDETDYDSKDVEIEFPKADFTSQQTLCSYKVQFTDKSEDPAGNGLVYAWTFYKLAGPTQLGTSSLKDPAWDYGSTAGSFKVRLIVTDKVAASFGCADTLDTTIVVTEDPVADMGWQYCSLGNDEPVKVTFNNHSTGINCPMTFEWDYGDGTAKHTTTSANPHDHTYSKRGTYPVGLKVKDSKNKTATDQKTINIVECVSGFDTVRVCPNGRVSFKKNDDVELEDADYPGASRVRRPNGNHPYAWYDTPGMKWVRFTFTTSDSCFCKDSFGFEVKEVFCCGRNDGDMDRINLGDKWPSEWSDEYRVKLKAVSRVNAIYNYVEIKAKFQKRRWDGFWHYKRAAEISVEGSGHTYMADGTWAEVNFEPRAKCNCALETDYHDKETHTLSDPEAWWPLWTSHVTSRQYQGGNFAVRKGDIWVLPYVKAKKKQGGMETHFGFDAGAGEVDPGVRIGTEPCDKNN